MSAPISEGEAVSRADEVPLLLRAGAAPLRTLSGGEWTRLQLLLLMLDGANCLLLDEPTNHLDIQSVEMLESALESFDGTAIFVSHDRYFLDRIADRIVEVSDGGVRSFEGGWSNWRRRSTSRLRRRSQRDALIGLLDHERVVGRADDGRARRRARAAPSRTATATAFAPSSREVGSSASSSAGRAASARAIATRARSPCESRATRCVARSARPTDSSAASAAGAVVEPPRSASASSTFSSAERCGTSPACWPT